MKQQKQKRRIIYMTDKQWAELGKTAKKSKNTRSLLIRNALCLAKYTWEMTGR